MNPFKLRGRGLRRGGVFRYKVASHRLNAEFISIREV